MALGCRGLGVGWWVKNFAGGWIFHWMLDSDKQRF